MSASTLESLDNRPRLEEADVSSDDEEEDDVYVDETVAKPTTKRRMILDDSDSGEDEEDDSNTTNEEVPKRHKPPRPSTLKPRNSIMPAASQRRRRRSSARFLRLSHAPKESITTNLGEVYKQAIRMNAENRINASNSWNLQLIENIDKFLMMEDDTLTTTEQKTNDPLPKGRVNFTKASCTLDASVKIYSYRVDDVHLTSYKVLANLNRTDTNKKNSKNQVNEDDDDPAGTEKRTERTKLNNGPTLETNVANMNLNKLDSAFDIDPLFHKMSKTFDEGGAKGLLLVNLGVGHDGCKIVFDSSAGPDQEESKEQEETPMVRADDGMVDITSLRTKLDSVLNGQSIDSFALVPQLASLRAEYSQLDTQGFVDNVVPRSRRYAPEEEEEKEADRSIHQEALERSRASAGRSLLDDDDDEEQEYAADDFGGGFDDDDDDGFDNFIAADEHGARFSSISFSGSVVDESQPVSSQTTVLLDAIASGTVLAESEYDYFDSQALSQAANNGWAGAAHWKRAAPRQPVENAKKTPKKTPRRQKNKERIMVNLTQPPDLTDILRQPPKSKTRKTDPLQMSKSSQTKHTKNDNLLPPDAGIGVEQLSSLFLRPNMVLKAATAPGKSVGFNMGGVETFGGWDDGSLGGDDDDGPGFCFGGDDDESNAEFVVEELEGIRKVDKVSVGYATVAKKVDVKRLKRDLWTELEAKLEMDKNDDDFMDENKGEDDEEETAPKEKCLSFQDAVKDMEAQKTQIDVTLPFYFICVLHLANEKGLRLDSHGLDDFAIYHNGENSAPSF